MTFALWLTAAMSAASSVSSPSPRPLHLVTEMVGSGVSVSIVGESRIACDVHYLFEFESKASRGRSHSVQRGQARLRPGIAITVATMTLANVDARAWSAKLTARRCDGGGPYEEISRARE